MAGLPKPDQIPRWADTAPEADRLEPVESKKDVGWKFKEKPPYTTFNWFQNLTGRWFGWLDERFKEGADSNSLNISVPPFGGDVTVKGGNTAGTNQDGGKLMLESGHSTGSGSGKVAIRASEAGAPGGAVRASEDYIVANGEGQNVDILKDTTIVGSLAFKGNTPYIWFDGQHRFEFDPVAHTLRYRINGVDRLGVVDDRTFVGGPLETRVGPTAAAIFYNAPPDTGPSGGVQGWRVGNLQNYFFGFGTTAMAFEKTDGQIGSNRGGFLFTAIEANKPRRALLAIRASTGEVLPGSKNAFAVGSNSSRWREIWGMNVYCTNSSGTAQWPKSQADLVARTAQNAVVARAKFHSSAGLAQPDGDHFNIDRLVIHGTGIYRVYFDQAVDSNCSVLVTPITPPNVFISADINSSGTIATLVGRNHENNPEHFAFTMVVIGRPKMLP